VGGVGTGFDSNPQDYIEVDATHAYVARYGVNLAPGAQPFDSGSDVLVIDTEKPAITASIPMPSEEGLPPSPAGLARVGDTVLVVLQRTSTDFMTVGESAIVGITGGVMSWEVRVTGLKNCGRPAISPSGATMALGCSGQFDMNGAVLDPKAAAIAVFDVTALPPKRVQTFPIADKLGSTPQQGVSFAAETLLFAKTQTPFGGATDNQAFLLDIGTGQATVVAVAAKDAMGKGKGAVYNDVLCRPGCDDVCLLADGDLGRLRRWKITPSGPQSMPDVTVETMTGLPPVSLGGY
jgi:hypothetical protein